MSVDAKVCSLAHSAGGSTCSGAASVAPPGIHRIRVAVTLTRNLQPIFSMSHWTPRCEPWGWSEMRATLHREVRGERVPPGGSGRAFSGQGARDAADLDGEGSLDGKS